MRTLPSSEHEINCLSGQKISDKKTEHHGWPVLNSQRKNQWRLQLLLFIRLLAGADKSPSLTWLDNAEEKLSSGNAQLYCHIGSDVVNIPSPSFKMHPGKWE